MSVRLFAGIGELEGPPFVRLRQTPGAAAL
jgi:hypothetical protein